MYSQNLISFTSAIIFLFFCTRSYGQEIDSAEDLKYMEIRLDPRSAIGEKIESADLFSKINYIPLETNSNSYVNSIDQLEVTNDYYIILDRKNSRINGKNFSAIFIFKRNGTFHGKIDKIEAFKFSYNRLTREIVVYDLSRSMFLQYFTLNCKKIREIKRSFSFLDFAYLHNGNSLYYRNFEYLKRDEVMFKNESQKFANLIVLDSVSKIKSAILPFDTLAIKHTEVFANSKNFFNSGLNQYFVQPYTYSVYYCGDVALRERYRFILPLSNYLPDDFVADKKLLGKRLDYLLNHKNAVFSINNFYEIGDNLVFTLNSLNFSETFFYNIKSTTLYCLSLISESAQNFVLPPMLKLLSADETMVYSEVRLTQDLLIKMRSNVNSNFTSQFQDYLKSASVKDNPIIIEMTPQKKI